MDEEAARDRMVDALARTGRVSDGRVLEALRSVPRHAFVPEARREEAYRDRPLPIGHDQTVSAPHMVAIMSELLAVDPGDDVLEVGTGCGYHAAVTAELVAPGTVYSVEYVPELAARSRETLADLGYDGVEIRAGDGHDGWPEHAPYDAAYLTCAAAEVPDAVVEQVRPGGRVVAPVGRGRQELVVLDVGERGVERSTEGSVRFVPMRGGDGPRN
jgi:protein-L-isoaspartate(D-aspartate) O-methyltransferase